MFLLWNPFLTGQPGRGRLPQDRRGQINGRIQPSSGLDGTALVEANADQLILGILDRPITGVAVSTDGNLGLHALSLVSGLPPLGTGSN